MTTLDEYSEFVYAICSDSAKQSQKDLLMTCALGLNDESGEVASIMKKHFYHGHPFDNDHFIKEIGDVLWYVALSASAAGVSLTEVMDRNMEKLKRRYPDAKFSTNASINRGSDFL